MRYPVLWERTAPRGLATADWSWPDARLAGLRERGISPIVGLVHHGSGPAHTSLIDDGFAIGLEEYAGAVAQRYPWVMAYTPVNEPLTTARFSALYGHWYPHHRDPTHFVQALLNQCTATARAMRAIRLINPQAQFVITEDLGSTRASPQLQYQADHENRRRWLSIDLLCGRVDRTHPLRPWLRHVGASERALDRLVCNPCPPDIIGLNYYVTSERYLDDALDAWPVTSHGGNDRHRYADVEAVRACGLTGIGRLLQQAWDRYQIPLAISEVHLGCTREEQLRWLAYIVDAAQVATAAGIPVRAVTIWAMFGSFDWHCLVTRNDGFYEPGVFDVRGPEPRATALAWAVRTLAAGQRLDHPVLAGPGWWQRCGSARELA